MDGGPVGDYGCPEGGEEGEEEGGGEGEEEGGEGGGEALLGEGAVGVEDACGWGVRVVVGIWEGEGGVQKKRPFQILRRSRVVKVRLEVRYVCRDERAFSRVRRSVRWGVFSEGFF